MNDLRVIEYVFNYFFPIFQKHKFGESHRLDSSEFLTEMLSLICGCMNEKHNINFGYDIVYHDICQNCKNNKTKTNQNSNSYDTILQLNFPSIVNVNKEEKSD